MASIQHTDSRVQGAAPPSAAASRGAAATVATVSTGAPASMESARYNKMTEVFLMKLRSWQANKGLNPNDILQQAFPTLAERDVKGVLLEGFASYWKALQELSEKEFHVICGEYGLPSQMYELDRLLKRAQDRERGSERAAPADIMPLDALRPAIMEQKIAYAEELRRALEEVNSKSAEMESQISAKDAAIVMIRHSLQAKVEAIKAAVKSCEPFLDASAAAEGSAGATA